MNNALFDAMAEGVLAAQAYILDGWTFTHYSGECGCSSRLTATKGDLKVTVYDLDDIGREIHRAEHPEEYEPSAPPSVFEMNMGRKIGWGNRQPLGPMEVLSVNQQREQYRQRYPHKPCPEPLDEIGGIKLGDRVIATRRRKQLGQLEIKMDELTGVFAGACPKGVYAAIRIDGGDETDYVLVTDVKLEEQDARIR